MKCLVLFLTLICSVAQAQNRYATDSYGHRITPARISSEIEKRTVRIGEMEIGERVETFPEAMRVDDNGQCWLNPNYLAFPMKSKGEIEVIRNKLGYIVRVNYKYVRVNGYAVPRWSKWERGYVPSGFIPVKALVVDKPYYGKLSPSQEITKQLEKPYRPRFTPPQVPPNPYSLEKQNVHPRSEPRPVGPSRSILPELYE